MEEGLAHNHELLRTLALRLIDPQYRHYPGYPWSGPTGPAQLVVGQLPDDLELPVPDGCRVNGSVVFVNHAQIVVDASMSPKQVLAFYMKRLLADGWTALHHAGNRWNGFQDHHQPDAAFGHFVRNPRGPALNVFAQAQDGFVDVRLSLTTEVPSDPSPQPSRALGEGGPRPMNSCIPGLAAPPRSKVSHDGGQFSQVAADSFAHLVSELDLPALARHYAQQLEDLGWTPTDEGQDQTVAWSRWTFHYKDHAYRALMVFVSAWDGRYRSQIHARRDPLPAGMDWGWDQIT